MNLPPQHKETRKAILGAKEVNHNPFWFHVEILEETLDSLEFPSVYPLDDTIKLENIYHA